MNTSCPFIFVSYTNIGGKPAMTIKLIGETATRTIKGLSLSAMLKWIEGTPITDAMPNVSSDDLLWLSSSTENGKQEQIAERS